jgi:phosphopantothenoylcysteine decarboxylase/phosphopantothenate--cysteine ligase
MHPRRRRTRVTAPADILVTAGPTQEPIDAVRFIGNRSSGRMGIAIAEAFAAKGHRVRLLLGPTLLEPSDPAVSVERFRTAEDLRRLLQSHIGSTDLLVMAAAVADFRPTSPVGPMIKLERGGDLLVRLEAVPDLLAETADLVRDRVPPPLRIGFALEEAARLDERARSKLRRKQLDAIVANPLETMDAPDIGGVLLLADGTVRSPGPAPIAKGAFARWLVEELESLLRGRDLHAPTPDSR